jgi:hypothetical protein
MSVLKPAGPVVSNKFKNPGVAKGLGGNTQPPTSGSRAAPKRSVPTTPQKAPPPMGARKGKR